MHAACLGISALGPARSAMSKSSLCLLDQVGTQNNKRPERVSEGRVGEARACLAVSRLRMQMLERRTHSVD
jgi:hypothetical protein